MIHYINTTVFNVPVQTIVNTVNCVGVMGAGLALEFQLRFPEMEKDYVELCNQKKVKVGRPYRYKDYGDPWILNFPTKNHWKDPSKIEWIEQGLKYFCDNYKTGGITSVAFPKLGCSHGGLEWDVVSPLMEKYLQNLDIDVFICKDTEKEASGTEGIMVQMLNNIKELSWSEELGMRADIKRKIIFATPINRFRDLRRVEGIGKQTYNDVFRCLYSLSNNSGNTESTQTSEAINLNLLEEYDKSFAQPVEQVTNSSQVNELKEIENSSPVEQVTNSSQVNGLKEIESSSNGLNLKSEELSNNGKDESQIDNSPKESAFDIMLPHLEKFLSMGKTKDDIVNRFELPKKLIDDWLKKAEELKRISKVSKSRPLKYIATSSAPSKQLSLNLSK